MNNKPVLYRTRPNTRGVTYVLTESAYDILCDARRHVASGKHIDTFSVEAMRWAAFGCFTFIDPLKYYGSKVAAEVYTASYGLLDRAKQGYDILLVNDDLPVPDTFASGDLELFREFSDRGWGPKTAQFVEMVEYAIAATKRTA